ncbi:hypothetical protein [Chenggangzhangella methanolivorans]|uniref:Uncharacterized protein n=1 Tax=Chenggangzhangella methanolivorans TaxID=1437009 RepID=A0A9E6R8J2_9HYPH|nr:hypothetical protein [Chenggangzhangella methanolivorans]QZO00173.1 hypothetical protein K6K41_27150 [Chenggangzhangella methanolivorans]
MISVSLRRLSAAPLAACVALMTASAALAAAPISVDLVFYAPHFQKLENGSTISYSFVRKSEDPKATPSFEDEVKVNVGPQGAEDSVRIDLFTGDRGQVLGNMSKTGNPVIVAILEEDVKDMQKTLGGSPFYFRTKLREALAAQTPAEPTKIEFDGKTIDGWKVSIKPFQDDAKNRGKLREFAERSYELTFSDEVPGGLYALKTVTPKPDGGVLLTEELRVKPKVVKADAAAPSGAAK